jgi:hypothetical protein
MLYTPHIKFKELLSKGEVPFSRYVYNSNIHTAMNKFEFIPGNLYRLNSTISVEYVNFCSPWGEFHSQNAAKLIHPEIPLLEWKLRQPIERLPRIIRSTKAEKLIPKKTNLLFLESRFGVIWDTDSKFEIHWLFLYGSRKVVYTTLDFYPAYYSFKPARTLVEEL